jgi:hypothetical protein
MRTCSRGDRWVLPPGRRATTFHVVDFAQLPRLPAVDGATSRSAPRSALIGETFVPLSIFDFDREHRAAARHAFHAPLVVSAYGRAWRPGEMQATPSALLSSVGRDRAQPSLLLSSHLRAPVSQTAVSKRDLGAARLLTRRCGSCRAVTIAHWSRVAAAARCSFSTFGCTDPGVRVLARKYKCSISRSNSPVLINFTHFDLLGDLCTAVG